MTATCHIGTLQLAGNDWVCPSAFVVLVLGLISIAVFVANQRLKEKGLVFEKLESTGFHVLASPTEVQKLDAYAMINRELPNGLRAVSWIARGEISNRTTFVIEHLAKIQRGRHTKWVYHTFAIASCPVKWPSVWVSGRNIGDELLGLVGINRGDVATDSAQFNREWRVNSPDPDFANLILSGAFLSAISRLPYETSVYLGRGKLVVGRKSRATSESIEEFAAMPAALLALLPPELDAYQTPAGL
ncbi:MAG: hypothetical protein U0638_15010 [Phycisphaerales bacterium]